MWDRGDLPILRSWTMEIAGGTTRCSALASELRRPVFRCGHGWVRRRGRHYSADSDADTGVSATGQGAAPVSSKGYGVGW